MLSNSLAHSADRRTVGALALIVLTPALFMLSSYGGFFLALLVNALACFVLHVINHNAFHVPLFTRASLNRCFSRSTSALLLVPASAISASHIYNHHVHTNGARDWMNSGQLGETHGVGRLVRYVWTTLRLPALRFREGSERVPAELFREMRVESCIIAATLLLSVLVSVKFALGIFASRGLALVLLFCVNLAQHDELDGEQGVNRSRNFLGPAMNYLLFNNGYHSGHHLFPSAHWSELPALHACQVRDQLAPTSQQPSLVGFFLRQYFLVRPSRS